MTWVTIKETHVNANHIDTFYWLDGKLRVWFTGDEDDTVWEDPDQKLYRKMCQDLGVDPAEKWPYWLRNDEDPEAWPFDGED